MTAIEQQQYLNQHATIFIGGIHVDVLITNLKQAYGRTRYEVSPLQGTGRVWVENLTLKEDAMKNKIESLRNEFIEKNTKPGTPNDCTNLDKNADDCLQCGLGPNLQCDSCREYDRVLRLWEASQESGVV